VTPAQVDSAHAVAGAYTNGVADGMLILAATILVAMLTVDRIVAWIARRGGKGGW
jgi:hypothetical protein